MNGFGELMGAKLVRLMAAPGRYNCIIDKWQRLALGSRQFLKGWGANLGKERRIAKLHLLG